MQTPREDDESVKEAKLYETAKTVDLARKWTKGFRLAENIPVPKFYEASLSSMDMKSNSKKVRACVKGVRVDLRVCRNVCTQLAHNPHRYLTHTRTNTHSHKRTP